MILPWPIIGSCLLLAVAASVIPAQAELMPVSMSCRRGQSAPTSRPGEASLEGGPSVARSFRGRASARLCSTVTVFSYLKRPRRCTRCSPTCWIRRPASSLSSVPQLTSSVVAIVWMTTVSCKALCGLTLIGFWMRRNGGNGALDTAFGTTLAERLVWRSASGAPPCRAWADLHSSGYLPGGRERVREVNVG